jgi:hypothetical protein
VRHGCVVFAEAKFYVGFWELKSTLNLGLEVNSRMGLPTLQRHCTENSKQSNIPRNETAVLHSQFPHSCFCKRFIFSHNRSQIHECGNWERSRAVSFRGIHKSDLLCNACSMKYIFYDLNSTSCATQCSWVSDEYRCNISSQPSPNQRGYNSRSTLAPHKPTKNSTSGHSSQVFWREEVRQATSVVPKTLNIRASFLIRHSETNSLIK